MPEEEAKEDAEENAPAEQGDEQGEESASDTDEPQALTEDAELEAAIAAVRGNKDLPRPPYPTLPNLSAQIPMAAKVQAVQTYIEKLQYNFTGVNYFDVRKQRPMGRIMETAREITRQALPIKCVEAVFLGTYLTQGLRELERVPISFKSVVDGQVCKHIVLALKYNSKWGSLGLSRRRELYYKELVFDSLAELFLEYKRSYERVFHTLKRVKVGLPMSHDVMAGEYVCWDYLVTKCTDVAAASERLAEHGRCAHRLQEQWRNECKKGGSGPPAKPPMPGRTKLNSSLKKGAKSGAAAEGGADSESSEDEAKAAPTEEEKAEQAEGTTAITDAAPAAAPPEKQRSSFLAV